MTAVVYNLADERAARRRPADGLDAARGIARVAVVCIVLFWAPFLWWLFV